MCYINKIDLTWERVTDLAVEEYPISLLEKLLSCFRSVLWVFIHLHCEAVPDQFCIWLNGSRVHSHVHFQIYPAISLSSHIINKQ